LSGGDFDSICSIKLAGSWKNMKLDLAACFSSACVRVAALSFWRVGEFASLPVCLFASLPVCCVGLRASGSLSLLCSPAEPTRRRPQFGWLLAGASFACRLVAAICCLPSARVELSPAELGKARQGNARQCKASKAHFPLNKSRASARNNCAIKC